MGILSSSFVDSSSSRPLVLSSCRPTVLREMAVAERMARRKQESFKGGQRSMRQGAVRQKN